MVAEVGVRKVQVDRTADQVAVAVDTRSPQEELRLLEQLHPDRDRMEAQG